MSQAIRSIYFFAAPRCDLCYTPMKELSKFRNTGRYVITRFAPLVAYQAVNEDRNISRSWLVVVKGG